MDKAVAVEAMHHVITVVVDFGLRVIYRSHVWMFGAQFSEGPDLLSCTSILGLLFQQCLHLIQSQRLFKNSIYNFRSSLKPVQSPYLQSANDMMHGMLREIYRATKASIEQCAGSTLEIWSEIDSWTIQKRGSNHSRTAVLVALRGAYQRALSNQCCNQAWWPPFYIKSNVCNNGFLKK